jgi:predicted metal-dependent hydrolase
MAYKTFELPNIGTVTIYKRRGAKAIKLSLTHDNKVRVTLPPWAPYKVGLEFARSKSAWIASKQIPKVLLQPDSHIGKAHRLAFYNEPGRTKIVTRTTLGEVRVMLPSGMTWQDSEAQDAARKASKRALKSQAETLLPKRLQTLALNHDFNYQSVSVKHLKGRWGSCSQHQDIVLNSFLMQLPWELIDYVILHELVHTRIMAHGDPFWSELAKYIKDLPAVRKEMRKHQPIVISQAY